MDEASDPTLAACCLRDLEDQRRARELQSKLAARDTVAAKERAAMAPFAAARSDEMGGALESALNETGGGLVVVLASDGDGRGGDTSLAEAYARGLDDWTEAGDGRRWIRFRGPIQTLESRRPALLVFNDRIRMLTLTREQLEAEPWYRIAALLTTMIAQVNRGGGKDSSGEEDEEEKNSCPKPGCDRRFHHVHVQSRWRNEEFLERDRDGERDGEDNEKGT